MNAGNSLARSLLIALLCCNAVTDAIAGDEGRKFIYQWNDDRGIVHITDNLQNVPQKYRSRATQLMQPDADKGSAGGQAQQGWRASDRESGDAAANEELKKAEWQQRMIDAKLKLQYAEEKYGQLENRKRELQSQWGSAGAALPTQEAMDEMKQVAADLASAKVEVDKARDLIKNVIPDEARRAGIPPGWLREVE